MTLPLGPQPTPREVADRVNSILLGKINSVGTITLTPSATTTVLSDASIGPGSFLFLSPMSASASTAGHWFEVTGVNEITIHHASLSDTDLDFAWAIYG